MKQPLVSIVVICYNYGQYLKDAVESALSQTHSHIEIIIINDGSTDSSDQVAADLAKRHKNIRYIKQENQGVVYTRNRAIEEVQGEYYIQLDADDYLDKEYVEKTVAGAIKYDADIVYTNYKQFGTQDHVSDFPEYDYERLKNGNFIHAASLVKKSAVGDIRFDPELAGMSHEDWEFFLHLCATGKKAVLCKDVYLNYRIHGNGRNNTGEGMEHARKYVDVYSYIVRKRIKEGRQKQFGYLAIELLGNWYAATDDMRKDAEAQAATLEVDLQETRRAYETAQRDITTLNLRIQELLASRPYRIGTKIMKPAHLSRRACRKARRTAGVVKRQQQNKSIEKAYAGQIAALRDSTEDVQGKKFAVVIHMYYPEIWSLFLQKLSLLPSDKFDLFVTIPEVNAPFMDEIRKTYPHAHAIISPNKGRDILPFLKTLTVIHEKNYRSVLKFHTKKSTHWDGGHDWMNIMLDEIIPDNKKVMKELLKVATGNEQFGVIGPSSVYYPLTINYPANANHLATQLAGLYDEQTVQEIATNRKDYGFFGGSMIWIDRYVIEKLLRFDNIEFFEPEAGQVDGTFAHAIERLISLIPEIEGKDIFESDSKALSRREYPSDNIPEWSEDHDK